MIYLDNAATTFKKPRIVYKAVTKGLRVYSANPGRSGHTPAYRTMEAVYDTREVIADFFNAKNPENIVFTYNATYALNIAIKSLICEPCHVVISDMEHNSVLRPLYKLAETLGIEYSIFDSRKEDLAEEIESKIRTDTKFLITTLRSNVTGRDIDTHVLNYIKNKYGLKLIVDASQAAGHKTIDLNQLDCDALACPGHKGLFGITGSGFVIFKDGRLKNSVIEGGSGNESINPYMPINLPEAYEAGTLGVIGILSVGAGINYINKIGLDTVERKLNLLTEECISRLENLPCVKIIDGANGIVSIVGQTFTNEQINDVLNKCGICIRGGLHCAPLAHKALKTLENGTLRISFSSFNKIGEIDKLYKCLKRLI